MGSSTARRTPVQRRSRERVERALLAAERIVVEDGVEALSTRSVAEAAEIPVASLYQYFEDRDAIIRALIERQVEAMAPRLAAALEPLQTHSIRTIVEAIVGAYVDGYRDYPSFVVLWFQGRVNPEIDAYVRQRGYAVASAVRAFATRAGLVAPGSDPRAFEFASEMVDAFLRAAYREDRNGDARIVAEGIEMIVSYIERYATPRGRAGIPAGELTARFSQ